MNDQDEQHIPTPRGSLGSGALSFSSGSSSSTSSQSSAKTAVSECLGAWLNYLQVLNNLCSTGFRLAQTISTLENWGQHQDIIPLIGAAGTTTASGLTTSAHFTNAWDDLQRATAVATSTVKSHVISVLQDFITSSLMATTIGEQHLESNEIQRTREHNQQIILENQQTLINIQHQFCAASYDAFSTLTCCFSCQVPVGFSHDPECTIIQKQNISTDQRSQTPSPHFGGMQRNEQYRPSGGNYGVFGSGSTQASSEHVYGISHEQTRGPSPHEIRGPSPVQGFLENIRGPLPNPGHLLGMKAPFYRGSRSPLNFPLFPLNGQRRWSEAAVRKESSIDVESQMRRWSMPWEASKTDKNIVTFHQTRIMPISKLAVSQPKQPHNDQRSQSTTPDSSWQHPDQDGLAEAIQLLSCRPRILQQQQSLPATQLPPIPATYEIWPSTDGSEDRLPSIKFPKKDYYDKTDNPTKY